MVRPQLESKSFVFQKLFSYPLRCTASQEPKGYSFILLVSISEYGWTVLITAGSVMKEKLRPVRGHNRGI